MALAFKVTQGDEIEADRRRFGSKLDFTEDALDSIDGARLHWFTFREEVQSARGNVVSRYNLRLYTGKSAKPEWTVWTKPEMRAEHLRQRIKAMHAAMARKAEAAEARAAVQAADYYKPGDIILYSWGWEQTNPEFYVVEDVRGKCVTVRAIGQRTTRGNSSMSDYVAPDPSWRGPDALTKRVLVGGSVKFTHGYGHPFTGSDTYRSWYA